MYQELKVGDKVSFNIPEIFRSCLPMKTKEMIAEMYKDEFTVERVDPDTGYVYLKEFVGKIPFNPIELIRTYTKKFSEKDVYNMENINYDGVCITPDKLKKLNNEIGSRTMCFDFKKYTKDENNNE